MYSSSTYGTHYFVSITGDNSHTGLSEDEAWLTIQKALNSVSAGDTIFITEGTYTGQMIWNVSGEPEAYITLMNYEDDLVILDASSLGNNIEFMFLQNMQYVRIEGLQFTGHNGNYQPIINCYGENNAIEIKHCKFYNTNCNDSYAILIEGYGNNFIIEDNIFENLEGENAVGILCIGTDEEIPLTNIVIHGNILNNIDPAPSEGIAVNGNINGFVISENTLSDINNIGIVMIGGEDWVNENDSVNIARNGICKWNTVKDANSIYGGGYAAGIYVDGGQDIIVENNIVTGSDIGLEIGCENHGFNAKNIIVRNNILYKNEKSGLGFGGYDYPTTGKVSDCKFYGNTVFDNDSLLTDFGQLWIQYAENCTVENNIFYASASSVLLSAYDWNFHELGTQLKYNLYYSESGIEQYLFDHEVFHTLADYQTASLEDENSFFAQPLFVNSDIFDFHITEKSPAHNAGNPDYIADLNEFDMDSTSRNFDRIDIGADEFNSSLFINEQQMFLTVFPNPSNKFLFIKSEFNLSTDATLRIYSLQGKLIKLIPISDVIDISPLSPGHYLLQYVSEMEIQSIIFEKL